MAGFRCSACVLIAVLLPNVSGVCAHDMQVETDLSASYDTAAMACAVVSVKVCAVVRFLCCKPVTGCPACVLLWSKLVAILSEGLPAGY